MSMGMTATEMLEHDARFRARVLSAVARATEMGRAVVAEDDLRWPDVHHIATEAAMIALRDAYEGDAEIAALRIERDHYKKLALHGLETRPLSVTWSAPTS